MSEARAITFYIDADACPVKEETYKVAARHKVPVVVVSNSSNRRRRGEEWRGAEETRQTP